VTLTYTPTHSHGPLPTGSPADRFTSRDPEAFELPSGRDEEWRFTPLAKIRRFFEPFVPDGVIEGTNHVPAGAQVDVVTPSSLRSFGAALVPADRVSALAMQRASHGLHVQVDAGADIVPPIVLERIGAGGSAYVHHVVDIGPNARATVVFDHRGAIQVAGNVEVVLGDGASLQLVSINDLASPKANAICERVIGTIRRECLDWLIPLSESHLRSILKAWVGHYNHGRSHMALGPGVPDPPSQVVRSATQLSRHRIGERFVVRARSLLGGLHHEYCWCPQWPDRLFAEHRGCRNAFAC